MVADLTTRIKDEKWGTNSAPISGITVLDFNSKMKSKAQKQIQQALNEAWVLGVNHSRKELDSARKQQFNINMGRIDDEAAEFLRTSSFRMLGLLNDDMRAVVQQVLVNGVKFSWTSEQIVDKIYDELMAAGFIAAATNSEATARTIDEIKEAVSDALGSPYRIQTAVRTNVFEAINEARYSTFTDPELDGFVEALEYSAILDSRTTQICRHLDDRIYPVDSPQCNKYRPPNHYNCRSILVPVTIIDTDVVGKDRENDDSRWSRPPGIDPQKGFG
jgi:SPP1 gp7 family putative phage head morphogenesis protein